MSRPVVFVNDVTSFASSSIASALHKKGYALTGSLVGSSPPPPQFRSVVPASDRQGVARLVSSASVLVLTMDSIVGLSCADEIVASLLFSKGSSSKRVVLIGSIGTWGLTPCCDEDGLREGEYAHRVPLPSQLSQKRLEDSVLSLPSVVPSLSCSVVTPGLLYGNGECELLDVFIASWSSREVAAKATDTTDARSPYYSASSGAVGPVLPTCNISSLVSCVSALLSSTSSTSVAAPVPDYVLVCDGKSSDVRQVVSGVDVQFDARPAIAGPFASSPDADGRLQLGVLDNCGCEVRLHVDSSTSWRASGGVTCDVETSLIDVLPSVCADFVSARNLMPIKLCVTHPLGLEAAGGALAASLAASYRLPSITLQWCADVLLAADGSGFGSSALREEVTLATSVDKDLSKLDKALAARVVRSALLSPKAKHYGYVLLLSPDNALEQYLYDIYGKTPTEEEEAAAKAAGAQAAAAAAAAEAEKGGKGKKDDDKKKAEAAKKAAADEKAAKDSKKGGKDVAAVAPVIEDLEALAVTATSVDASKLPTVLLSLVAGDGHLLSVNGFGDEAASADATAFKAKLDAFRREQGRFGRRPAPATVDPAAAAAATADAPPAEPTFPLLSVSSVEGWFEAHKPSIRSLSIPQDAAAAEQRSVAFLEGAQRSAAVASVIENGQGTPGIVYLLPGVEGSAPSSEAGQGGGGGDAAVGIAVSLAGLTLQDSSKKGEEKKEEGDVPKAKAAALLPHEKLLSTVTVGEYEEVKDIVDVYTKYMAENVMKDVTMGMMEVIRTSPSDPIDFLAEYLMAKGKLCEREGEGGARTKFTELLKHVDELSSRIFQEREENSTFATGFSQGTF